jgi:outer membrane protein TolC
LQTGYANYLALITAEAAYQQALINRVQAQANRFADTAALFLALGGGWWNDPQMVRYDPSGVFKSYATGTR